MRSLWAHRLRGGGEIPPTPPHLVTLKATFGGFLAICLIGWLAEFSGQPLVLGSLGASCVMLFGFPDLPFSQPRNVLLGHLLAVAIGLACLTYVGATWWSMALALTMSVMIAFGVTHPPAGSNPIIVFMSQPSWDFLLFPTLAGVLGILLIALVYNNVTRASAYPKYW